ncbi:glycoside hydrolase family 140 protein [Draconibacterium sediminis]|uniref:glycoside hydrolase family 140 protein n=1 Tax=Draconibacterium sediminis TaxID=1544798 RepID=UPI0026EE4394|nr:glycoside hydrolase family 140 protein [Draconibacterium sediminis]
MVKTIIIIAFSLFTVVTNLNAQRLMVSQNGRYLVTEKGDPFFWLGDTAWELLHRCDSNEINLYLGKRASQGFNVVQTVVLAELDGLNTPNPYGNTPLKDNDPRYPNDDYFQHVDYAIAKASELGMYIALLPTWGDKLNKNSWGEGPEVFNLANARSFGEYIGARYADCDNVIWIIGGDRNPREDSQDVAIWNAMAEGIASMAGGYENTLMSYHPQPKEGGGSSTWFHNEQWLDFNMHQTGHCANQGTYLHITHDYNLRPIKPVLDGEPLYEDHPNCFNAKELGYSIPDDIRRIMYWNVFAGAFGQTYGCHDVWQMYKPDKTPVNQPLRPWPVALDLPMANQMKHLKNLMLSRPVLTRIPDQSMVLDSQPEDNNYVIATRDGNGTYAMIYFPTGKTTALDFSELRGPTFNSWWFDPRTGNSFEGPSIDKSTKSKIKPPTFGKGHDWVLVVDSAQELYNRPGKTVYHKK